MDQPIATTEAQATLYAILFMIGMFLFVWGSVHGVAIIHDWSYRPAAVRSPKPKRKSTAGAQISGPVPMTQATLVPLVLKEQPAPTQVPDPASPPSAIVPPVVPPQYRRTVAGLIEARREIA